MCISAVYRKAITISKNGQTVFDLLSTAGIRMTGDVRFKGVRPDFNIADQILYQNFLKQIPDRPKQIKPACTNRQKHKK